MRNFYFACLVTCRTMQCCSKRNVHYIVGHVKPNHTINVINVSAINVSVEFPPQNLSKQEMAISKLLSSDDKKIVIRPCRTLGDRGKYLA